MIGIIGVVMPIVKDKNIQSSPKLKSREPLLKMKNLKQYKMPNETGLSYRTVLRTLKPLESQGFIKLVRLSLQVKGGKENKIYALTLKGVITCLNSYYTCKK